MIEENNNTSDTSKNNLEDIAPTLLKLNKNNAFVVPKEYFDQLPATIIQRCYASPKKNWLQMILFSFKEPKYILRYSFILLFLFLGSFLLLQISNNNQYSKGIASYSASEQDVISEFIIDEDFDESELIDAIADNSEFELKPINTIDNSMIESTDIINYIIEEDDENNDYIY